MTINSKPLKKFLKTITNKAVNAPKKNKEDFLILLFLRSFGKSRSIINRETNVNDDKNKVIKKMLKDTEACFWICSKHKDSADDHKNWQGEMYFNTLCKDPRAIEYAKKHKLASAQWVMGSPVYLCTRPNCRHYFEKYTLNSILNGDYTIPTREVGEREMGTPRKREYQERLEMLQELWKIKPTDLLRRQIEKTKMLIKRNA